MRFVRGIFGNHREDYLSGMQVLQPLGAWDQFAVGWKNRRDTHQILRRDAGIAKGELERRQPLAVLSHTFGEKDPLGDHVFAQFICLQEVQLT